MRAIRFGGAAVGSPVWGTSASPIKNREEGGALLNNQLIVGGSGMGDVRAEGRWGGSAWGDTIQLFGVVN
jgi:hypothetical protein